MVTTKTKNKTQYSASYFLMSHMYRRRTKMLSIFKRKINWIKFNWIVCWNDNHNDIKYGSMQKVNSIVISTFLPFSVIISIFFSSIQSLLTYDKNSFWKMNVKKPFIWNFVFKFIIFFISHLYYCCCILAFASKFHFFLFAKKNLSCLHFSTVYIFIFQFINFSFFWWLKIKISIFTIQKQKSYTYSVLIIWFFKNIYFFWAPIHRRFQNLMPCGDKVFFSINIQMNPWTIIEFHRKSFIHWYKLENIWKIVFNLWFKFFFLLLFTVVFQLKVMSTYKVVAVITFISW